MIRLARYCLRRQTNTLPPRLLTLRVATTPVNTGLLRLRCFFFPRTNSGFCHKAAQKSTNVIVESFVPFVASKSCLRASSSDSDVQLQVWQATPRAKSKFRIDL